MGAENIHLDKSSPLVRNVSFWPSYPPPVIGDEFRGAAVLFIVATLGLDRGRRFGRAHSNLVLQAQSSTGTGPPTKSIRSSTAAR